LGSIAKLKRRQHSLREGGRTHPANGDHGAIADGEIEPATAGSTRPIARTVVQADIVTVNRFRFSRLRVNGPSPPPVLGLLLSPGQHGIGGPLQLRIITTCSWFFGS